MAAKAAKVTVKVADNLIPGGGHLVNGVAKVVNVGSDVIRGVDDVASVKPAKTPGAPTPHTPVANTLDLAGGNRVVANGPNLMQDVRAPKVPASPVGDVADLAESGSARKAPVTHAASEVADDARATAAGQRPATPGTDVMDSSRGAENRVPDGSGSRTPEVETSKRPENAGSRAPEVETSRLPEPERVKTPDPESSRAPEGEGSRSAETTRSRTVEVETSRLPEPERVKTPDTDAARAPEVEGARGPEAGAGKSPDVPEVERVPREAGSRITDDAVDVDAHRSPETGDAVEGPEARHSSTEPDGETTAARETTSGGDSETTSVRDPNQWPGEELAPGAERRPVPKGDRDWWYDEDGYPHEKGDPDPETTFRGEGGDLHNKEGGRYATDPNPPERVDGPETVKAQYSEYGPDDNIDGIRKEAEGDAAFTESVEHRQGRYDEHQADVAHLDEIADKFKITADELKQLKGKNPHKLLQYLVAKGRLTDAERLELVDALVDEKQSMTTLKNASEFMGEAGAESVMKARKEISLFGDDSRPGAGHLDKVGVRLDPPRISVYEAKGGGGPLGTSKVDGVPHQQGTGPYLQKLLEQDSRIAQALADLIERHGPDADVLKEAIAKGEVEIGYELVRSQPSGRIKLSKFQLEEKPTLPDGIIKET